MDSIGADAHVQWRAIRSTQLHHVAYWTIILWELATGCICGMGAIRMFFALRFTDKFETVKRCRSRGLWLGLLLWALVFITIGGEWFLMWESSVWNGEAPALRMFILNAFALLFLYLPDAEKDRAQDRNVVRGIIQLAARCGDFAPCGLFTGMWAEASRWFSCMVVGAMVFIRSRSRLKHSRTKYDS